MCLPSPGYFGPTVNVSLGGSANLLMSLDDIDIDCEVKVVWEIKRTDGETELYTVVNDEEYRRGRYDTLPERGLSFGGYCHHIIFCTVQLTVDPIDMRYNEAQITGVFSLPKCFNTSNTTNTTTLESKVMMKGKKLPIYL